jgi:spore germination cell wall hydrolase CwlJ-like protein
MITLGASAFFLLTSIIAHSPVTHNSEKDLTCMAHAVYYEAGNQGYEGKVAVANVIMNRVDSEAYPDTICGVVTQPNQFSYLLDADKITLRLKNKIDKIAFEQSLMIGYHVAEGRISDNTDGSTHYYAQKIVTPYWKRYTESVKVIEDHTFVTLSRR